MSKQKTLKGSFSLCGKGLHTGLSLTVTRSVFPIHSRGILNSAILKSEESSNISTNPLERRFLATLTPMECSG